jgi:hypothetical protein
MKLKNRKLMLLQGKIKLDVDPISIPTKNQEFKNGKERDLKLESEESVKRMLIKYLIKKIGETMKEC